MMASAVEDCVPPFIKSSRNGVFYQTIVVIVERRGPLFLQLRMHSSKKCVAVQGFELDEDGERGEVELSGRVFPGDILVDINGKSLEFQSFKEILRIIRSESENETPRVLSFLRFLEKDQESCYFGEADIGLKDDSTARNDVQYLHQLLCGACINMEKIRLISENGLPAAGGMRSLVWKVLLGYLPTNSLEWDDVLKQHRALYKCLKEEFLFQENPVSVERLVSSECSTRRPRCATSDFELLESIDKDVVRTNPELPFFDITVQFALTSILFIYAKMNMGVGYVQGMNELAATMYFVFANDNNDPEWSIHAEADTFFCFTNLMSEFQDLFIHKLDESEKGLQGSIEQFSKLVEAHDPSLYESLKEVGLEPTFYSVRWITTLFSREFDLMDTIRIWDSLLAASDKHNFVISLAFVMLTELRDAIFGGQFSESLKMLQAYPLRDVPHLLQRLKEFQGFINSSNSSFYTLEEQTNRDSRRSSLNAKYFGLDTADALYSTVKGTITNAERIFKSASEVRGLDDEGDLYLVEERVSRTANCEINQGFAIRMPESVHGKALTLRKWAWNGMGTLMQLASDRISTTNDVFPSEDRSISDPPKSSS